MENPYKAPDLPPESTTAQPPEKPRASLVLPIFVPPAVHLIARTQLARNEYLLHGLIVMVGVGVANAWALWMVDRLKLPFEKSFLFSAALGFGIFLSWMLTAKIPWP